MWLVPSGPPWSLKPKSSIAATMVTPTTFIARMSPLTTADIPLPRESVQNVALCFVMGLMPPQVCLMALFIPLVFIYIYILRLLLGFYNLIKFPTLISYSIIISVITLFAEVHMYCLLDCEDMIQ